MRRLATMLLAAVLTAGTACAQWLTPARQISVSTNGWGWIDPAANTVQGALDFIDDNQTDWTDGIASNTAGVASNAARIAALEVTESNHYVNVTNRLGTLEAQAPFGFAWAKRSMLEGLLLGTDGGNADIDIAPGYGFCGTNFFALESATNITVAGVSSNADFYYVYVAGTSSFPDVTLKVAVTEPTKYTSLTKWGWYSGSDRCIGAVYGVTQAFVRCAMQADGQMLLLDPLSAEYQLVGATETNLVSEGWTATTVDTATLCPLNIRQLGVYAGIYNDEEITVSDPSETPGIDYFPECKSFIYVAPDDFLPTDDEVTEDASEMLYRWGNAAWGYSHWEGLLPVLTSRSIQYSARSDQSPAGRGRYIFVRVTGWVFDR